MPLRSTVYGLRSAAASQTRKKPHPELIQPMNLSWRAAFRSTMPACQGPGAPVNLTIDP